MKYFVYASRDKKLGAYQPPEFKREDQEHVMIMAARSCALIKDENEKARAADFALYYLGQFDDVTAKFELLAEAEKLIDYEDYILKGKVEDGKAA